MTTAAKNIPDIQDARHQEELKARDLLEQVLKAMSYHPDDISVRFKRGDKTTIFFVDCSKQAIGQIIGARGRNIQSLRNIVSAMTNAKGFRSIIEIPYLPLVEA